MQITNNCIFLNVSSKLSSNHSKKQKEENDRSIIKIDGAIVTRKISPNTIIKFLFEGNNSF
jgi:hypothetical protein